MVEMRRYADQQRARIGITAVTLDVLAFSLPFSILA